MCFIGVTVLFCLSVHVVPNMNDIKMSFMDFPKWTMFVILCCNIFWNIYDEEFTMHKIITMFILRTRLFELFYFENAVYKKEMNNVHYYK